MRKIHTRIKRKYGLSTHINQYPFFHSKKGNRPKTFKTEESAHAWASNHGLKLEQYNLKKVKHNKKFQVEVKNGQNKNSAN